MFRIYTILVFIVSCSSEKNYSMYDDIILQDLMNKQTELNILRELKIAQANQDEEAFKFFVSEYVRVPRLKLTAEQKKHPKYKEWLTDKVIKDGNIEDMEYNFINNK